MLMLSVFVQNIVDMIVDYPVPTVPKKDIVILLPYLGLQSNQVAKRLKSCVYKRHHLEALGNKLMQILIFILRSLEMMPFVLD